MGAGLPPRGSPRQRRGSRRGQYSSISDWLSDCVCQLAFGGGFASRTLFRNDERSVIYAQRPVVLVGIADIVLRSDLRDRSVQVSAAMNVPITQTSFAKPLLAMHIRQKRPRTLLYADYSVVIPQPHI